jgi:hypothetical protein
MTFPTHKNGFLNFDSKDNPTTTDGLIAQSEVENNLVKNGRRLLMHEIESGIRARLELGEAQFEWDGRLTEAEIRDVSQLIARPNQTIEDWRTSKDNPENPHENHAKRCHRDHAIYKRARKATEGLAAVTYYSEIADMTRDESINSYSRLGPDGRAFCSAVQIMFKKGVDHDEARAMVYRFCKWAKKQPPTLLANLRALQVKCITIPSTEYFFFETPLQWSVPYSSKELRYPKELILSPNLRRGIQADIDEIYKRPLRCRIGRDDHRPFFTTLTETSVATDPYKRVVFGWREDSHAVISCQKKEDSHAEESVQAVSEDREDAEKTVIIVTEEDYVDSIIHSLVNKDIKRIKETPEDGFKTSPARFTKVPLTL